MRSVRIMKLKYRLKWWGYALGCWAAMSACERRGFSTDDSVPIHLDGLPSAIGGSSFGGGTPTGTSGSTNTCQLDGNKAGSPTFAMQTLNPLVPARKELYALVTDAEAKAFRAGGPLVPLADRDSAAPLRQLLSSLRTSTSEQRRKLGDTLAAGYSSWRTTWPNPWALRLVEHPGSEHMNLLRIVLRDDAFIVRIAQGAPVVIDLQNASVPIEIANGASERIAAIYYQVDNSQPLSSTGDRCENGTREVALGSEAMVEEWSLESQPILNRLNADIDALQALFDISRKCTNFDRGATFRSFTTCQSWQSFTIATEYLAYQWSLSTPVEAYKPTPQNLASLIQALQDDRFEPAPFVVRPEPPAGLGGDGSGGAGGAGTDVGGAPGAGGAL